MLVPCVTIGVFAPAHRIGDDLFVLLDGRLQCGILQDQGIRIFSGNSLFTRRLRTVIVAGRRLMVDMIGGRRRGDRSLANVVTGGGGIQGRGGGGVGVVGRGGVTQLLQLLFLQFELLLLLLLYVLAETGQPFGVGDGRCGGCRCREQAVEQLTRAGQLLLLLGELLRLWRQMDKELKPHE